jgi:hypothetical protein
MVQKRGPWLATVGIFWMGMVFSAAAETQFDRDIVVKDQTRAMKVEAVFKELLAAYEDEDVHGFLERVSDERFRQDYITFTDALYSDFRNYEIHRVDYWIDRVVSDHVRQFLFVRWEKRYESLDSGRVMTQQGFSRFLFDEVDGQYLLVELAGNSLFGASLREWLDEVPRIAGEEMRRSVQNPQTPDTPVKPEVPEDEIVAEVACSAYALGACLNPQDCTFVAGGFWYEGRCNSQAQVVEVCDANHLYLCTSQAQCEDAMGQGYWYGGRCNTLSEEVKCLQEGKVWESFQCLTQEESCRSKGLFWYDDKCNMAPPRPVDTGCSPSNLSACTNEFDCVEMNGGFWESNTCIPPY